MILRKVWITGYRSIRGREELLIDPQVTVLVGANDHGKTNVLAAVLELNDESTLIEERHWDCTNEGVPSIEWHFDVTDLDREELKSAWTAALEEDAPEEEEEEAGEEEARTKHAGARDTEQDADDSDAQLARLRTIVFRRAADADDLIVSSTDVGIPARVAELLLDKRPRIELFSNQPKILDEVTRAQLETPEFEFMKGIFMKAGLWEDRATIFTQDETTSRKLEEASERLTEVLQREWEQGAKLAWRFVHSGTAGSTIQLLVKDPAVQSKFVRPSRRSSGFTAFFFLAMTTHARTADRPHQEFVFLFDEPGTYLHPIAQINLQRVFERLAVTIQLLYTTHSMFLVNKNVPSRNRVILKTSEGTLIDKKPFARNWKAMRESLGIMLTHNWLIADRTLLVEGASDELYLIALFQLVIRANAADLDLNDLSIMQGSDSANLVAMACVMLEEGRKVVVLVDGDRQGDTCLSDLRRTRPTDVESGALVLRQLPRGKSTEDIVALPAVLDQAVCDAASELVRLGIREWEDGKGPAELLAGLSLARSDGSQKTYGAQIVEVTGRLLKPRQGERKREGISKTNVALRYDESLRAHPVAPGDLVDADVVTLVRGLATALGLGSRIADSRIEDEAPLA